MEDKNYTVFEMNALKQENERLRKELGMQLEYQEAFYSKALTRFKLNLTKDIIEEDIVLETENGPYSLMEARGLKPPCGINELFLPLAEQNMEPEYRYWGAKAFDRDFMLQMYQEGFREDSFEYRRTEEAPGPRFLRWHILMARDPFSGDIIGIGNAKDVSNRYRMQGSINQKDENVAHAAVLNSLSEIYYLTYYIDVKYRSYIPLTVPDTIRSFVLGYGKIQDALFGMCDLLLKKEYSRGARAFVTLETLPERMKETDYISEEFETDAIGWVRATFIRADSLENGEVASVVLAVQEINSEKQEQLKTQKALEEALSLAQAANRAKTTFLNNMSHDIRTPMNAIIGYTGLAASHVDNKEQVLDYLSKIGQSSDHLLSLINDVLDMSRIESGKMNLDEKEENLSAIIHTLRDIVQHDIRSKQLEFFVDAVDVNDEDVICDKLRLNQVLLNVLSNAIKYTPAGGTVIMHVTEKTVKRNGYASYEFIIKDNGMGMSPELVEHVFDPFERGRSSTVSGIQGTGLGMAITKNIVDMMGGTISVESEPEKGTAVTVRLDLKLQSAPREPEQIPELKGVRALVVDDDSNTCISIAKMVRDIGMRDEWCTSGKEAVIRAEEAYHIGDVFKVYVIDWLMPDMNGIETTRRIRKVIGDDAPIIILTAYDWSDIEEEAREAGVTAFVSKPMFPSDLYRVLSSCMGKAPEEKAAEQEYHFRGKKILLVEDNVLNREIATELLTENGLVIDTAEDGDIAVERIRAAKEGDYDLILMDIQMPRMDGYEATRQIRALGTAISRIPILAMTANAFEEDRKLSLAAGMNEHIAKPFKIELLKKTLAKYL